MLDVSTIRSLLREDRENARVLIVDDEPAVCAALSMALDDCDLQSVSVGTAEEACELLEEQQFQLLVSDKNLPLMSGIDLFSKCKELAPELPMIMMTGYASMDTVSQALAVGAIDYIAKPFEEIYSIAGKLTKIVDRQIHLATYERISAALLEEIRTRGHDGELSKLIGQKLGSFKRLVARSPDVVVFEDSIEAQRLHAAFKIAGLKTLTTSQPQQLIQLLDDNPTVGVGVVALDHPESMHLLRLLKKGREVSVVLSTGKPELHTTLAALALGATDLYMREFEDPATLAARLQHTIKTLQRKQLYARLFATLYVSSDLVGPALIKLIDELAPDSNRKKLAKTQETSDETDDASAFLEELSRH